ncbi:MAG: prepilin-type N-terminal cleavage/methylation domain-containing protein [Myxococcaceae bacterium]|nr:prepilin-type N-terminal cleavage/methylation domain-containing protein [Myxococcaceae bacterium]
MKRSLKRGFTLLEMMIVVTIVGIMAAIAANSFTEMRAIGSAREETRYLLSALRNARTLAVATTVPHGIYIGGGADNNTPNFRNRVVMFRKVNADQPAADYVPGSDVVLSQRMLPVQGTTGTNSMIIFDAIQTNADSSIRVIFDRNGNPQIWNVITGTATPVTIAAGGSAVLAIRHRALENKSPGVTNRSGRCIEMIQNGNTRIFDAAGTGGCW